MKKLDLEEYKSNIIELYNNGYSMQEIINILELPASISALNSRLHEWGVQVSIFKVFSKEAIEDIISLYSNLNSLNQIAVKYKTSPLTIRKLLSRNNIQIRTYKYSPFNKKLVELTDIQKSIIDGLILGDGGLVKIPEGSINRNSSLVVTNIYKEFLNDIALQLKNIKFRINTNKAHTSTWKNKIFNHKESFRLYSESLIIFKELYFKWYTKENNYKKYIPYDLEITPYTLLYWFYGDGSYCKQTVKDKTYYSIVLYTNNFSDNCLDLLLSKLEKLNLPFRKNSNTPKGQKKQYCLKLYGKENLSTFFNLLPDNTLNCFSYKFPEYKNKLEQYAITN